MNKSPSCSHSNVCILSFHTALCQHWPLLLEFSAFCFLKPVLCQLWKTSTKYWMWMQGKPMKRVTYLSRKTSRNLWYMDFMIRHCKINNWSFPFNWCQRMFCVKFRPIGRDSCSVFSMKGFVSVFRLSQLNASLHQVYFVNHGCIDICMCIAKNLKE